MSGDDGLREALLRSVLGTTDGDLVRGDLPAEEVARLLLEEALPVVTAWHEEQVAALRARAAAADRVRELHTPLDRGAGPRCQGCSTHVTFTPWPCATVRALDGSDRTDRGRC